MVSGAATRRRLIFKGFSKYKSGLGRVEAAEALTPWLGSDPLAHLACCDLPSACETEWHCGSLVWAGGSLRRCFPFLSLARSPFRQAPGPITQGGHHALQPEH